MWFLIVFDSKNIDLAQCLSSSSSFKRNLTEGILNCFKNSSLPPKRSMSNMAKNAIFSSVSTLLLPISVITPYPHGAFIPQEPPRIMTLGSFSTETYWLLRCSRAAPQNYSPLFIQMRTPVERAIVRIGAQILEICPQLHVCQTLSWSDYTMSVFLSFFFFFFLSLPNQWATWWKSILAFRLVSGTFGLYHAGICWEKPDGRYLRQPSHALYNELSKCHNCIILMLIKICCLQLYWWWWYSVALWGILCIDIKRFITANMVSNNAFSGVIVLCHTFLSFVLSCLCAASQTTLFFCAEWMVTQYIFESCSPLTHLDQRHPWRGAINQNLCVLTCLSLKQWHTSP